MNATHLRQQLDTLTEQQWQQLLAGGALEIVDDATLRVGDKTLPHILITAADLHADSVDALRQATIDNAEALIQDYYRRHPLTQEGFNRQARALIDQYGAEAFAATADKPAARSLFVDGGDVVAEPADSPKYPYGVHLELDHSADQASITTAVKEWIDSGKAYEDYRGMNVCRYNC